MKSHRRHSSRCSRSEIPENMSDARLIVGVDVGGTNVVVGTVPEDGSTVHGLRRVPTRVQNGAETVVKQIGTLVQESLDATRAILGSKIEVAGVGSQMDEEEHSAISWRLLWLPTIVPVMPPRAVDVGHSPVPIHNHLPGSLGEKGLVGRP